MTTGKALIAAAALAAAGTAGMAGWLTVDPDELRAGQALAAEPAPAAAAELAVTETEAAVLPPPAPTEVDRDDPAVPSARTSDAARASVARVVRTPPAERQPARTPAPSAPAPRNEPIEPIEPSYISLLVPANSVVGVRLATGVSSETAGVEDRVEASVTRDVIAGGRIAIPAGARLIGSVNEVTRGGKFRETARLGVRFHTLVMDDGARVPVRVETVVREGTKPARQSAVKIGAGAVGGAIIGGIMGGKKGAVIGGMAGAGAGSAAVAAGDRSVAELVEGALLSVRLLSPVTVMIERNQ